MKAIFVLQHTNSEFLGLIEDHLEGRGVRFQYVRPFAGGSVPGTAIQSDGLIVLGGGPWATASDPVLPSLREEVRLAKDFLNRRRPVIGFGLGAQILCLAAGGQSMPRDLAFGVGTARRVAADVLNGFLPAAWPLVTYMRDRPVMPAAATVLAVDDAGEPALFQLRDNCFGFTGHPGYKVGMLEDLVMEFEDTPADCAAAIGAVLARQGEIHTALAAIMTGLMQATGLMRPGDEAGRRVMPLPTR